MTLTNKETRMTKTKGDPTRPVLLLFYALVYLVAYLVAALILGGKL